MSSISEKCVQQSRREDIIVDAKFIFKFLEKISASLIIAEKGKSSTNGLNRVIDSEPIAGGNQL
jgi:hypothetical protein